MVDAALELAAHPATPRIHALSRRGLLPQPHRSPAKPYHPQPPEDLHRWPRTARGLLRAVRREVRAGAEQGTDWREVVTSLRAATPTLWQSMNEREQRRWLDRIRPFWEVHRHRSAPQSSAAIEDLRRSGRLLVHAGRITAIERDPDSVRVRIRPRGSGSTVTIQAGAVVNCCGPQTDLSRITDPLLHSLRERRLIAPDPLGLGLLATQDGAAIEPGGRVSANLFVLGPLRRPQLWETTAVPELRLQAAALADHLLGILAAK
jgi:uncharacterized NAD(P)/FAD-binding protein YdhS